MNKCVADGMKAMSQGEWNIVTFVHFPFYVHRNSAT